MGEVACARGLGLIADIELRNKTMDEGVLGITVFVAICITFSLLAHWKLKTFWVAMCSSVLLSVVAFQIANYLHIGYLDPLYIVAMVTSGLLALAISSAIGILFYALRASL
jgi:glucan phosphoethanolaminetransferase (alkaline phosphatase superfamily)